MNGLASILRRVSIRQKLMVITLLTTGLALLVACAVLIAYDRAATKRSLLDSLRTICDLIGSTSTAAISFNDSAAAGEMLASLRAEDEIVAAAIYTADGGVLAAYFRDQPVAIPPPQQHGTHRFGKNSMEVFRGIELNSRSIGTMYARSDLAAMSARRRGYASVLVAGALIAFTVAALLVMRLQRYISQPILELIGTANKVAATNDYSPRAVKRSDDELGALIDRFNGMLAQIEHRDAELRRAQQSAEAANTAKDRFLAVLSHELRTPLTPVLLCTSSLQSDARLPADVREQLRIAQQNVELEAHLIDDLLDLTRISRGKIQLKLQSVCAHELLRRVQGMVEAEVLSKQIDLAVELGAARCQVRADSVRLQQVFWNVIKNAVKFTPEGGRINVRTDNEPDGSLRVEVSDSGAGIAPDVLPRIFDAFDQGNISVNRRFGGLGLGLTISKALLEMHGGTISAASGGAGHGARFTIRLPSLAAAAPASAGPSLAPTPVAAPPVQHPLRILLIEDHEPTRHVLLKLLTRLNCRPEAAVDVQSALHQLEHHPFDLILSDLGLPDGNGCDIMRAARERNIRGIALTGYGMEEHQQLSRDAGFSAHLIKPVDVKRLEAAIQEVASRDGRAAPHEAAA